MCVCPRKNGISFTMIGMFKENVRRFVRLESFEHLRSISVKLFFGFEGTSSFRTNVRVLNVRVTN